MGRRLFEDLVVSAGGGGATRGYAFPVSIVIHAAVFGTAVIVPLLLSSEIPASAGGCPGILVTPALATPAPPPAGGGRPAPLSPRRHVDRTTPAAPAPDLAAPPAIDDFGLPEACLGCDQGSPGPDGGPGAGVGIAEIGPPIGPAAPPAPVRIGAGIRAPVKVKDVPPIYPDLARRTGVSGIVILECTIDATGRVVDARILRGNPLLDAAALAAVQQWVYRPTLLNGVPVPVILTVTVRFELRR